MAKMIGNELVRELVETVILTAKVKGADPVSLLLIAAPESGKTSVVLERPCKAIEAFGDITGKGIHQVLLAKKDITHIVINDMVAVVSHRQSVNRYTISQLNSLTEEGIKAIAGPFGLQEFTGGKKGVIASLTLELAKDSRCWWNKVGFSSRMLPFCYYYPEDLIVKIKASIDEKSTNPQPANGSKRKTPEFKIPALPIQVVYPEHIAKEVRRLADFRAKVLREVGMRRLKQYHALSQAHALFRMKKKPRVSDADIEFLKRVEPYVSYDTPQPL